MQQSCCFGGCGHKHHNDSQNIEQKMDENNDSSDSHLQKVKQKNEINTSACLHFKHTDKVKLRLVFFVFCFCFCFFFIFAFLV